VSTKKDLNTSTFICARDTKCIGRRKRVSGVQNIEVVYLGVFSELIGSDFL
jgi:hypothetical protein